GTPDGHMVINTIMEEYIDKLFK
ncbi:hypothetical protein EZS27_032193, partial [termite gut metagenome]